MKAVREARVDSRAVVAPATAERFGRLRRWLADPAVRVALAATLGLRVALSAVAALTVMLQRDAYVRAVSAINGHSISLLSAYPTPSSGLALYLVGPWLRWDASNYLTIALHGYSFAGSSAYLPLYPLLIRLGSFPLGGNVAVSALLVSTCATFAMFLLLFRLIYRLTGSPSIAGWSVAVACLLPLSFFFMAPYTEALFCVLALAAMLAALEGHWGKALLWAALASLTRQQGLLLGLLAVPAISECLEVLRQRHSSLPARLALIVHDVWRPLAFALAPLVAYGAWIAVLVWGLYQGTPWQELTTSPAWKQAFTWPGVGVIGDLGHLLLQPGDVLAHYPDVVLDAACTIAAAVGIGLAWKRLPPGLLLYLAGCWCLAVVKIQMIGVTTGAARYLLAALPLCLVPGAWLARAPLYLKVAAIVVAMFVAGAILNKWVLWTWIN